MRKRINTVAGISLIPFFCILATVAKSQERAPHLTDSLIKVLHVKSSTRYIGTNGATEIIFYDRNGRVQHAVSTVEYGVPMIKASYVYDSLGRLYSCTREVCKPYLEKCVLLIQYINVCKQ